MNETKNKLVCFFFHPSTYLDRRGRVCVPRPQQQRPQTRLVERRVDRGELGVSREVDRGGLIGVS